MAKSKSVNDFDARIADLRRQMSEAYKGRKAAVEKAKGVVGETVLNVMPSVPTEKAGCKTYFQNVVALISAHSAEFEAMFGTKAETVPVAASAAVSEPVPEPDEALQTGPELEDVSEDILGDEV